MEDPTGGIPGWPVVGYIWGLLMTLVAWVWQRQAKRTDHLEKSSVSVATCDKAMDRSRDELAAAVNRFDISLREHRAETKADFARVFERLDRMADRGQ